MVGLCLILVLSLFAKETCVLIPLCLLIYELTVHQTRISSLPLKKWALLFAIPLLYLPLYQILKDPVSMYQGTTGFSIYPAWHYLYAQAYYQGFLPILFLNPSLQSIIHGVPGFTPLQVTTAFFGVGLWIASPTLVFTRLKKHGPASFFLLFFFLNYLPTNSFFQMVNPFAEYRLYLCVIPLAALLSFGVDQLGSLMIRNGKFPNAKTLIPLMLIFYFGLYTFTQVQIWRDEVKIYTHAAKRYPLEEVIYYSLAISYLHARDLDNAFIYLTESRTHAGFIDAKLSLQLYTVAALYFHEGKFKKAWNVTEYLEQETSRVPLPPEFYELRKLIQKELKK